MARAGTRHLAAILFTDIVDSTAVASRLGDTRWRSLIARHHAVVRRALKEYGGTELDTAGDGFFTSFREPAAAIRCACRIAEEVRRLGVEIRAGVHFGECERAGGKLSGLAVVVGARVMALGGPGDVMVTGSTGELVAGSGISFEARGEHALKGVEGTWRVWAVTALDDRPQQPPAGREQADERLAQIGPSPVRSPARRRIVAGAVAATVVVGTLLAITLPGSRSAVRPINLPTNATARIDAVDASLEQVVPHGERPGASALGFGSVWVAWPDRGRVARLDPADGSVVDTIPVGATPAGLTVTDDAIWVANASDGTVVRIDPTTNEVSQTFEAGTSPTALASGAGALWVADSIGSRLLRLDPVTGKSISVPLSGQPSAVAFTPDGVWVSVEPSSVARIDPDGAEVTFTHEVGNGPSAVLAAAGSIWVANRLDGTVSRLDPVTGNELAKFSVGEGPSALAEAGGRIWVASEYGDAVLTIDPEADRVGPSIPVGATAASLAAEGDVLWLTSGASDDDHRGGTLEVASDEGIGSLDPAVAYDPRAAQILSITHDGLVAYRKTGGPSGATLVADLALSLPQISDDGLTYRFVMRDEVRYSTGQTVAPEDFRHSLERAVSLNSFAAFLFDAIPGVRKCDREPAECDLSEAIRTDGASISITLARPDSDLLYKLALPFGSVLPASTPASEQAATGVPGTGPYLVARADRRGIELVRNPEFAPWSVAAQPDGYVDSISWRFGQAASASLDRVLAGDLDLMTDEPTPGGLRSLLAAHPGQAIVAPQTITLSIGFDTRRAPFDDPRVRRAVNFAIDRGRAAQLLGGSTVARVTCQVLPPSLPGFEASCPYTRHPDAGVWSAPDLRAAKSLISAAGAPGARVRVLVPPRGAPTTPGTATMMRELARTLREIGLRARAETPDDVETYFDAIYFSRPGSAAHAQVFVSGWSSDYPRPSNFLETQFRCGSDDNFGGYCDRGLDARIDAAKALERSDPGAATRAWTAIEQEIVREAAQAPLVNDIATYAVSTRTGNVQVHPQWRVLLSRLWVQ